MGGGVDGAASSAVGYPDSSSNQFMLHACLLFPSSPVAMTQEGNNAKQTAKVEWFTALARIENSLVW